MTTREVINRLIDAAIQAMREPGPDGVPCAAQAMPISRSARNTAGAGSRTGLQPDPPSWPGWR